MSQSTVADSTPTNPGRATDQRARHRRWRRLGAVVAVLAVVFTIATLAVRQTSPVGHWTSADALDEYLAAYELARAGLPEPAESIDVRTSYGVVRAERYAGANPGSTPLVLLPGTASGGPVFADNLPSLLTLREVYLIDLLGEPGRSIQSRPITTAQDKAQWLREALEGLAPPRFHVLGLSIGGWTAANLAAQEAGRPDSVLASVTLLDPVQVYGDIPLNTVFRSIPAAFAWMPRSWRDSFNSYTAGGVPVEREPVADMIEAGMRTYVMRQPDPARLTEQQLQTITTPVLAIVAGRSVMHDPAAAVPVAERAFGPDNVRLYAENSHAINGEAPERIAADVGAFIDGVDGASRP